MNTKITLIDSNMNRVIEEKIKKLDGSIVEFTFSYKNVLITVSKKHSEKLIALHTITLDDQKYYVGLSNH